MTTHEMIGKLRNPYGQTPEEMKQVRLAAADRLLELEEQSKGGHDAYVNMREFAESQGLDTVCHGRTERRES